MSARGERGPRRPRPRAARGPTLVGRTYELDLGPVAHGGHVVARLPGDGRVVFVRHGLPGEGVLARVTEGSAEDRYLRADAVEVLRPSPDRVAAPCPFAGPGRCGGCDFQHVDVAAQRRLKATVVEEQVRRLAGLDLEVTVEPVPGDRAGLRWRTRMGYHRARDGSLGLLAHRSHTVVPVDDCRIAHPDALVSIDGMVQGPAVVTETVAGRPFQVGADGFWQVHAGAPDVLVEAVTAALAPAPGDRVADLYAGVGLFSAFLAELAGPTGRVVAVEGGRGAARHAEANLGRYPWAEVVHDRVDRALASRRAGDGVDLVVLDPPREGARRVVVDAVADLGPRAVAYVACDPAALARDLAYFAARGYRLDGLRAFDLFPMTHHVECVAHLVKGDPGLR